MFLGFAVADALEENGWKKHFVDDGWLFGKKFMNVEEVGMFSDGSRVINLTLDKSGRWLARVDAWGKVKVDVDLREFKSAKEAIDFVLKAK